MFLKLVMLYLCSRAFLRGLSKLGKGRGQGFLDGLCILGQHSINVDTLGKTHCANVFVSLDPESDFASQFLSCSTKLVGEIYQSKLNEERGFWETD